MTLEIIGSSAWVRHMPGGAAQYDDRQAAVYTDEKVLAHITDLQELCSFGTAQ
jgi:hypothetical protein